MIGESGRLRPEGSKKWQDSSTVMLWTSLDGLETNSLVIDTFIINSQVLPYGGLFINSYWIDKEGEPVASKYLLSLKVYMERRASFDSRSAKPNWLHLLENSTRYKQL